MPPFGGRVHGVLDDPDGQRRAVALAGRRQFRQVGTVGQDFHRFQGEGRGRAPQDVRPGGQELPGQRPGQELAVGQHQHARAEASLSRAGRGPGPARNPGTGPGMPRAGSRSRTPPPPATDLRERPVTGLVGRPAEVLVVRRAVRHVRRRPVDGHHPQPAAGHPGRLIIPDRPRDLLEQEPDRRRAELAPPPRQRGDVRRPPPPPLPRIHPAARIQVPGQQASGAPLMVQPVRQLDHHLPVPAVPAPEQPQRQHEIHHQPRRQQPAPLLPRPGILHRGIHQLRRENPGQDTDRDPVRQPPVRREPLRTIMRHKTLTVPRQTLKQRHCPAGGPRLRERPPMGTFPATGVIEQAPSRTRPPVSASTCCNRHAQTRCYACSWVRCQCCHHRALGSDQGPKSFAGCRAEPVY